MITVRHRTTSGRLDSMWEFDSERGCVEVVIRLASARPAAFTVKVCAPDKPRLWSHPIMRLDAESWRILPALWVVEHSSVAGQLPQLTPRPCTGRDASPFPCELHAVIGAGNHLALLNTPPAVDLEIAELDV